MFNDNQEFVESVAQVMYREWLEVRREQGYHHGSEHQSEDSWCGKCDGSMVEWVYLTADKKQEYQRMAKAALKFLRNVRFY